jgi:hypothetical protein
MGDPSQPRIEIFAPFGEAFELTKKILFQPFDPMKWLVIGFAAWLATFFSGGGGFNYRKGWNTSDWNWKAQHYGAPFSVHNIPPWVIPVMIVGAIIVLALIAVFLWLNARGRFMFTYCIVHNRGEIALPWREYRTEGNRLFVLQLVIALGGMVAFGALALVFVLGSYWNGPFLPLTVLIIFGLGILLLVIVLSLVMRFAVPVMYRRRCDAITAFRQVWALIVAHPGVFILFVLFYLVIAIAGAMIGCVAACLTCCVAALPYIGTVILLPVVMCLYAYPLCFIRQFGDPYDVFATVTATPPPTEPSPPLNPSPPPIPPSVPPIQDTPPSWPPSVPPV